MRASWCLPPHRVLHSLLRFYLNAPVGGECKMPRHQQLSTVADEKRHNSPRVLSKSHKSLLIPAAPLT